ILSEFFAAAGVARQLTRIELFVIDAANQQRELRAEMGGERKWKPVAQLVEDGRQHLPGDLLVRPELVADLVEPDVGGFQGSIENVQALRSHGFLPRSVRAWAANDPR